MGRPVWVWLGALLVVGCTPPPPLCVDQKRIELPACLSDRTHCGFPLEARVQEFDSSRAIDLLFVGDGVPISEVQTRSLAWVRALEDEPALPYGRISKRFNFFWLDLAGTGLASPLGTCMTPSAGGPMLSAQVPQTIRAMVPGIDVVVVVGAYSSPLYRPTGSLNQQPGIIVMGVDDLPLTLGHELGHSLFGLADEYVEFNERYPTPVAEPGMVFSDPDMVDPQGAFERPNIALTLSSTKFAEVHVVAEPGGGRYATGVFRSATDCLMRALETAEYCPVCAARVEEKLAHLDGRSRAAPRCGLSAKRADQGLSFTMAAADSDGVRALSLFVNGQPAFSSAPVRIDDETQLTGTLTAVPAGPLSLRAVCVDALDAVRETRVELP